MPKRDASRNERIAAKVQTLVAGILRDQYADDELLKTVSLVGASGGIQYIRLFFHCHTNDIDKVQRRLDIETKTIRYKMGNMLDQKYVPLIRFIYDDTLERAERIDELLASIEM